MLRKPRTPIATSNPAVLTPEKTDAAISAYFGEIAEDQFWGRIFPRSAISLRRGLPFEDGARLHQTAVNAVLGCPEKGIAPPVTVGELQDRLAKVFQTASENYKWKSGHLARAIAKSAADKALEAASGFEVEIPQLGL